MGTETLAFAIVGFTGFACGLFLLALLSLRARDGADRGQRGERSALQRTF
jgi:hypothetical protein